MIIVGQNKKHCRSTAVIQLQQTPRVRRRKEAHADHGEQPEGGEERDAAVAPTVPFGHLYSVGGIQLVGFGLW